MNYRQLPLLLAFLVLNWIAGPCCCFGWSFPFAGKQPSLVSTTTTTTRPYNRHENGGPVSPGKTDPVESSMSLPLGWNRRTILQLLGVFVGSGMIPDQTGRQTAWADEGTAATAANEILTIAPSGDVRKFFSEARALESQGNMAAAQRLYVRITQVEPQFIYGWSQLGNTQTALGELPAALSSYSRAIELCVENNRRVDEASAAPGGGGGRKCSDLYVLLLNRGSIRLNTGEPALALQDLNQANLLRGRPDAVILQNLARAKEINGQYGGADRDYTTAIMMTSNEVSPFWLRSAMVKFQLGDGQSALDLLKRVENKFPQAPEVRAAYAVLLSAVKGDPIAGQQKFLEIPDRARARYVDETYLTQNIAWPPAMREELANIAKAVGDLPR